MAQEPTQSQTQKEKLKKTFLENLPEIRGKNPNFIENLPFILDSISQKMDVSLHPPFDKLDYGKDVLALKPGQIKVYYIYLCDYSRVPPISHGILFIARRTRSESCFIESKLFESEAWGSFKEMNEAWLEYIHSAASFNPLPAILSFHKDSSPESSSIEVSKQYCTDPNSLQCSIIAYVNFIFFLLATLEELDGFEAELNYFEMRLLSEYVLKNQWELFWETACAIVEQKKNKNPSFESHLNSIALLFSEMIRSCRNEKLYDYTRQCLEKMYELIGTQSYKAIPFLITDYCKAISRVSFSLAKNDSISAIIAQLKEEARQISEMKKESTENKEEAEKKEEKKGEEKEEAPTLSPFQLFSIAEIVAYRDIQQPSSPHDASGPEENTEAPSGP